MACAAALASLELMRKNDVVGGVERKSAELAEMLAPLGELACVGEIRQKGFMVGIELVADKETRRAFEARRRVGAEVCMRLRRRGVILRPLGDVIVMMPPLTMGMADLRTIVGALGEELREVG